MTTDTKQDDCAARVANEWQARRADLAAMLLGEGDLDEFLSDQGHDVDDDASDDDKREQAYECFFEYGLAFDYVAPETFDDQPEGYFQYQISTGGPGDELRFFVNPDLSLHRAEYWYLDWFDGARVDVSRDDAARAVWAMFEETGTARAKFEEATD